MSHSLFISLSLLVMLSSFLQGIVGLGFALILSPVLGIFAPELVPIVILILMLPLNLYVLVREWSSLDRIGTAWVTGGRLTGAWIGVTLITAVSSRILNIFIGVATILACLLSLAAPSFKPGKASFIGAGFVTGITEAATAIGGPPLALIYQHSQASVLRSTIAMCSIIGEVASLGMLIARGQVPQRLVIDALFLMPAVIIGAIASRFFHHRIKGKALRTGVMIFSIGAGVTILAKELI